MLMCCSGNLSGGKTIFTVKTAYERALKDKKKIISNIRLNLPDMVYEFLDNERFVDFLRENYTNQEVLRKKFYNSVLLLDEAVNLISARRSTTGLNELITNFFMMAGKLDCDVFITAQILSSQIDLRLRDLLNVYVNCFRVTEDGRPLIFENRIYQGKIRIMVIMEFNFDIIGVKIVKFAFDPEPYYKMFDTREITLLDSSKYLRGGSKDLRG